MGWFNDVQVQAPTGQGYATAAQINANVGNTLKDVIKTGSNFFANEAVKDLMKTKPEGLQDPTAHIGQINSLLGYMTPEQAQAYRDYGSALQQSYGRNLEQDRFTKQQEFNREQLAQALDIAKAQNAAHIQAAQISAAPQYAQIKAQEPIRQAQALENLEKAKQFQIANEIKTNPNGAIATLMRSKEITDSWKAKPIDYNTFKDTYQKFGHWTWDSDKQTAYNLASQLLNTETSDPTVLAKQAKAKAMLQTGDAQGLLGLFGK